MQWNATVQTAGTYTAPTSMTLTPVGPFTIIGRCYVGDGSVSSDDDAIGYTYAGTFAATSQDNSALRRVLERRERRSLQRVDRRDSGH